MCMFWSDKSIKPGDDACDKFVEKARAHYL
jgi:hypothetical protein